MVFRKIRRRAFLMVSETVGLLIGIIILVIAIAIYVKACSGIETDPAKIDFDKFVAQVDDLAKKGFEGETKTAVIRLGRDNFVMNLWSSYLEGFSDCYGSDIEARWIGPGLSCKSNDCLCLVEGYKSEETKDMGSYCDGQRKIVQYTPTPKGIYCTELPKEYYVYGIDWKRWNSFGNSSRRLELSMIKKGNVVYVCAGSQCEIPANPENRP
ncbi:MAG: hypothetical protein AB1668_03775 [Nanoarchaeota archaeon]